MKRADVDGEERDAAARVVVTAEDVGSATIAGKAGDGGMGEGGTRERRGRSGGRACRACGLDFKSVAFWRESGYASSSWFENVSAI